MRRERETIKAMTRIYCRGHHQTNGTLCDACAELQEYALWRLEKCPFQEEKTTCANCAIHCYRPDMRERVRDMMRYAGPRMTWRHPFLAFMHLVVDGRKKEALLPDRKGRGRQE